MKNIVIKFKSFYKNGLLDGESFEYYDNGKKKAYANYENGLLNGQSKKWMRDGTLESEVYFEQGSLFNQ